MIEPQRIVYGGVDTHKEFHVAAVVDEVGRILGTETFPATAAGYRRLERWLERHSTIAKVGVEGTGSYGLGLARMLSARGIEVIEVNRANRRLRRRRGKSDTVDAEAAARAVLNGEATSVPKTADGIVEAIRALRVVFCSTRSARTRIANQIRDLLVTAGDNPERLTTVAGFAAVCGASPVEASSGKHVSHRLNKGANRDANHALWRIVMVRMTGHQRTKDYVARRRAQGKSQRFIIRCLKRHVASEVHQLLAHPSTWPPPAETSEPPVDSSATPRRASPSPSAASQPASATSRTTSAATTNSVPLTGHGSTTRSRLARHRRISRTSLGVSGTALVVDLSDEIRRARYVPFSIGDPGHSAVVAVTGIAT